MKSNLSSRVRTYFFTGLAIFIPLVATVYVVWIGFNFFDGLMKPLVKPIAGDVPGVSLIVTIIMIIILGAFGRITIGAKIMNFLETTLLRIPVVSTIYYAVREASALVLKQEERGYKAVVLVEYPRKGSYVIGFSTSSTIEEIQKKTEKEVINVYVPTTPNPTSGFLLMLPKEDIVPLDMTIEEAFKIIMSGGLTKQKDYGGK
jgi:uncharacterized membrane protein